MKMRSWRTKMKIHIWNWKCEKQENEMRVSSCSMFNVQCALYAILNSHDWVSWLIHVILKNRLTQIVLALGEREWRTHLSHEIMNISRYVNFIHNSKCDLCLCSSEYHTKFNCFAYAFISDMNVWPLSSSSSS